ncbi:MAG TPA: hybrid sensor histidine kinase/response regulator, partial [Roseiflexaceae bacterium]|nr:hybrid sensor histidine kinase/response regulator [Roseiflexaceae bacterium]
IMAQVLAAFREEQAEHRQAAGELLLELERVPDHPRRQELLDQLFREAHSLKGGARAASQPEIEQIAHHVEDVFSAVRQGRRQLTPEVCDPVYAALDAIGALMSQVSAGQPVDIAPYQPLLATLGKILDDPAPQTEQEAEKRSAPLSQAMQPRAANQNKRQRAQSRAPRSSSAKRTNSQPSTTTDGSGQPTSEAKTNGSRNGHTLIGSPTDAGEPSKGPGSATVRLSTTVLDSLLNEAGELMTCTVGVQQRAREARDLAELPARWRRIWRQTQPTLHRLQSRAPSMRPTVHYLAGRDEQAPLELGYSGERDTETLIEALAQANALIGDLERRLALHAHQATEEHSKLHSVTDRLHQQVRRTRMLPITTILSPLRLQVREMARTAGKQVILDLDDGGAEADRQVLERLGEVLMHLLRNAVDHGIEPADARIAHGKPVEGRIALRAEVSGDRLSLTIADDGLGLDLAAIRERALASAQWSEADLARMGEAELVDLIFVPGFSTRSTVSKLSGRGVGLDIVRSRVERMQGRVTVRSTPGAGCVFAISLPLSLTTAHGLLLRAGRNSYVLPLDSVQRIVPVAAHDIRALEGRTALLVDERPLALVHLDDLLGRESTAIVANKHSTWHGLLLGSGERQVVCLVDAVLDELELMVYRLPAPLQQVPCVAGATILADGKIVPILDVVDLLRTALGTRRTIQMATEASGPARKTRVLVVDDSITTRTLEKNILEAAGYQVRLATDGVEALRLLDQ